jgi:hypothetical protein
LTDRSARSQRIRRVLQQLAAFFEHLIDPARQGVSYSLLPLPRFDGGVGIGVDACAMQLGASVGVKIRMQSDVQKSECARNARLGSCLLTWKKPSHPAATNIKNGRVIRPILLT